MVLNLLLQCALNRYQADAGTRSPIAAYANHMHIASKFTSMTLLRLLKHHKLFFSCNKSRIKSKYGVQTRYFSEVQSREKTEVYSHFSNGRNLKLSTGMFARMADGCAVATYGDTSVMVTTVSRADSSGADFFPLTVDYKQKAAAAGRIPTNFLRRELGRTETEILASRIIDRSVRPLFPKTYSCETQVICNMLALDGINDPDVISINAASAALAVSDIPWNGPVGAVRLGFIDNEVILNPTRRELQCSSLNLIVTAAHQNLVIMLEGSAENILEPDLKKALKTGVKECQNIIKSIQKLQKTIGKPKRTVEPAPELSEEIQSALKDMSEKKISEIFTNYKLDKFSRDNEINILRSEVLTKLKSDFPEANEKLVLGGFAELCKSVLRTLIFENNIRCDGRNLTQVRDISCEIDLFKPLHGSALFQRGQTQVLCTVTLDSPDSALKLDTISTLAGGVKEKNFFLHYEFPPYATNETGKSFIGRREMGHGALAEKGIRAVIPKDYPFTIRLTSEVLESNGSSSMASVCGGSLALMDAGVPILSPVAGVAMGLITKNQSLTNEPTSDDYKILTDILGIEDYLGDMDFKIAGTKKGITALQADIKTEGLPLKYIMESLEQANTARSHILNIMQQVISRPRLEKKESMPVTEAIEIPVHLRGKFLGIGGCNIKKIFVQTGVHVNAEEDSKFSLFAPNKTAMDEAKEMINQMVKNNKEPTLDFGGVYTAKIVEIKDTGVMVTLYPTMPPAMLYNSQLDQRKVNHPSVLGLEVGHEIQIKYFGRDPATGSMRLSRKVLQTTNLTAKNYGDSANA